MQTIHLDISQKSTIPVVYSKQGDVGRKFKAVITDNGTPYVIPVDSGFSLWYSGSAGEGNYSAIGSRSAFSVSANAVTVELIVQMLVPGGGLLCLVLNAADGTQLGLWDIQYTVEAVPGMDSPAAQQYYTALSETAAQAMEAVASVPQILPVHRGGTGASTPADARAQLGAAPRGLVESWVQVNSDAELDSYISYYVNQMPNHTQKVVSIIENYDLYTPSRLTLFRGVDCDGFAQVLVIRELLAYGSILIRTGIPDGEAVFLEPWKWINPPMQSGQEYCLYQFCNELPVYTKLIALGNLSAVSPTVKANITGAVHSILDAKLFFWRSGQAVFDNRAVRFSIDSTPSGNTNITVYTDMDLSSYQCFLELRYTK